MDTSINQEKELENEQLESSYSQEIDYSFELSLRYRALLESYSYKKYRKTRNELKRISCFSDCNEYWKLIHLRIKCQEKIIEKKFQKHQSNEEYASILRWLTINEEDIQLWMREILPYTFNPEISATKLELLITFLLNQNLNYAKYCIHQGLLDDCLSFLALSANLIKRTSKFIYSPDSLFLIQKIYLFMSSLYIINQNYRSAKNYLLIVIKLAFKEIELRIYDNYRDIIKLDELNIDNKEHLIEILFNFTTAMYHLGVCYENEGDIEKAHQAYKQSKWFANSFLLYKHRGLTEFINDVESRIRLRIELSEFIKREKDNLGTVKTKNPLKTQRYFNELEKIKKFEKLEAFIEGLKLNEVDDEEISLLSEVNKKPMSQRVNVPTRTIHVLNYLMSTKFQDVVSEMDKIEINNLNKETSRAIEKKITSIKNNDRVKLVKDTISRLFNIPSKCIPLVDSNRSNDNHLMTTIPTSMNESTGQTQNTFLNEIESARLNCSANNNINNKTKIRLLDMKERPVTAFSNKSKNDAAIIIQDNNKETDYQQFLFNKHLNIQSKQNKHNQDLNAKALSTQSIFRSKSNKNRVLNIPNKYKERCKSNSKVEKIKYSKYLFNKSYRKKIEGFRGQFDKELRFQKNLLACKREEKKVVIDDINEKAIKRNCEIYFSNENDKQRKLKKEKEEKEAKHKIAEALNMVILKEGYLGNQTFTSLLNPFFNLSTTRIKKKEGAYNSDAMNKMHLNKFECDLESITRQEEMLKRKKYQKQR